MGIHVNPTLTDKSPLVKYRSVAKIDPKTKQSYQVGIVVRENGRFEVYSDFMLVNEYINPKLQCVDVETDFNQFVLKFVEDSHKVHENTSRDNLKY